MSYDTTIIADSPAGYWKLNERENLLVQSEDLSTTWAATGGTVTITTNVETGPDGTVTIDQAVFGSTAAILRQSLPASGVPGASQMGCVSFWGRVTSGTGTITFAMRGGATVQVVLDTTLRRYEIVLLSAATNTNFDISTTTSAATFRLGGLQLNWGQRAFGYVKTTTTVVTSTSLADSSGNARPLSRSLPAGGISYLLGSRGADSTDFGTFFTGDTTDAGFLNTTAIWNVAAGGSLTVEVWLNPVTNTSRADFITNRNGGTSNWGYSISISVPDGTFGYVPAQTHGVRATVGSWHHYVFVMKSNSTVDIYVDGVFRANTPGTGNVNAPSRLNVCSSDTPGSANSVPYYGYISHLAVYKTELSAAAIATHYAAMTGLLNQPSGVALSTFVAGDTTLAAAPPTRSEGVSGIPVATGKGARRRTLSDGFDG